MVQLYSPEVDESYSKVSWNTEKENEMVLRLTKPKNPMFKINVESIRTKEFEECTYHPQIGSMPMYPKVQRPKFYYETVQRLKDATIRREAKKIAEENYYLEMDKRLKRLQQMDISPPSFLERSIIKPQRKILFYVDITIKPGK